MSRQVFCVGQRHNLPLDGGEGIPVVAHNLLWTQERVRAKARCEPSLPTGGQHVVRAGEVVAEAHGRVGPEEDRAGTFDEVEHCAGLLSLDLEVFRPVGVTERSSRDQVAHQHDRRLRSIKRGRYSLSGERGGGKPREVRPDRCRQLGRGRDQHSCRLLIVLRLAHQVGSHQQRVCAVVGNDQDLSGPRLRVDPDIAAHEPLGRGDVDVARACDQVDRVEREVGHSVGQGSDGSRAAHRVNLVDAEQAGGAQDRGVHPPPELLLRRGGDGHRADAGDVRRNHVHHDARGIHRLSAGHIETHPGDRLPALDDFSARCDAGDGRLGNLGLGGRRDALDGLLESGAHIRVQPLHRIPDLAGVHPNLVGAHAIELLRLVEQRLDTALAHIGDELGSGSRCRGNVDDGARSEAGELGPGRLEVAKVKGLHHGLTMLSSVWCVFGWWNSPPTGTLEVSV